MARKQQPDGTEVETPNEAAPAADPAPTADEADAKAKAAAEAERIKAEQQAKEAAEAAAKAKAEEAARVVAAEAAAKAAAEEAERRRRVRVVVICDLEPWIDDAPRQAGDLVDDVEPELATLMQRRGHVRIIPN